jgi:hypothetical protein
MSARDTVVLNERLRGDTLRTIGDRHDLTPEGVRLVVAREGRRRIDELEMRLMVGRRTGEVEAFVIPDHGGPDFDVALGYFHWAMRELAKRGVKVRVHYRPAHNGVVFGVEDVTPYRSRTEDE